ELDEPVRGLDLADAAPVRDGHERLARDLLDRRLVGQPTLGGRADVEQDQFVDLLVVEDPDRVDRVADVALVPEPDGLDQPAIGQEQDGNHPRDHAAGRRTNRRYTSRPNTWLFSGWNCVPRMLPRWTAAGNS